MSSSCVPAGNMIDLAPWWVLGIMARSPDICRGSGGEPERLGQLLICSPVQVMAGISEALIPPGLDPSTDLGFET